MERGSELSVLESLCQKIDLERERAPWRLKRGGLEGGGSWNRNTTTTTNNALGEEKQVARKPAKRKA
jgi:hypothetical protein